MILTGTTLTACEADCDGIFGGAATPGSPCQTVGNQSGTLSDNCECIPNTTASLLTLECGAQIIQISGASAGVNNGGTATSDTRTIYGFMPDNGNGTPQYSGSSWPYVIVTGNLVVESDITATLTTNGDGMLLINGWPAYQFSGDQSDSDANGTFGAWNYFLPNGTLSQDACAVDFDCPDLQANIGDSCDDNNPLTENDVVSATCECVGTAIEFDCPALEANIGDSCDDNNPLTENDVVSATCECVGTAIEFDCPALEANIGDSCDDNNPNTENDMVNASCECVGTPVYDCLADGGSIAFEDGSQSVTQCLETDVIGTVSVMFTDSASISVEGAWVVADGNGDLIALPISEGALEAIDFHNFGETTSYIWFLSYDADSSNVLDLAALFNSGETVNASDLYRLL